MNFTADRLKVALIFFRNLKMMKPERMQGFHHFEISKKYATVRKGKAKYIIIN